MKTGGFGGDQTLDYQVHLSKNYDNIQPAYEGIK